jgi:hypothetical protein
MTSSGLAKTDVGLVNALVNHAGELCLLVVMTITQRCDRTGNSLPQPVTSEVGDPALAESEISERHQ